MRLLYLLHHQILMGLLAQVNLYRPGLLRLLHPLRHHYRQHLAHLLHHLHLQGLRRLLHLGCPLHLLLPEHQPRLQHHQPLMGLLHLRHLPGQPLLQHLQYLVDPQGQPDLPGIKKPMPWWYYYNSRNIPDQYHTPTNPEQAWQ